MRYILALLLSLLTIATSSAQTQKHSIEIDASSFTPVQIDAISGVAIDKIGKDHSNRECARIKMRMNRMTAAEIGELSVRPRGGNVEVMKCVVAGEGNGLIIELTAKEPTRFYLSHPKYGDSNEVSLNLEGNREYKINAELRHLQSIVVESNVEGADVYIDNEYKGQTNDTFKLTVNDMIHGEHTLRVLLGSYEVVQTILVTGTDIHFKAEIEQAREKYYDVAFKLHPESSKLYIDNEAIGSSFGVAMTTRPNGVYKYQVKAEDYFDETGEFEVKDDKFEKNISLKPAYGRLKIASTLDLDDAEVNVDGSVIEPHNLCKLKVGDHKLEIVKPWYKPYEAKVEIKGNDTTTHNIRLERNFAEVYVRVNDDAELYINDSMVGHKEWAGRLLADRKYTFEARKSKHHSVKTTCEIKSEPRQQSYTLPALSPMQGTLVLNGSPIGATVLLNGNKIGNIPMEKVMLIDNYNLYIEKEGYQSHSIPVKIEDGKTVTKTAKLTPIYAKLSVTGTSKAEVWIDGKKFDDIPFSKEVMVGRHTMEVCKEGYHSQKLNIEVLTGRDNPYNVNLVAVETPKPAVTPTEMTTESAKTTTSTLPAKTTNNDSAPALTSLGANVLITYKYNDAQVYVDGVYKGFANRSFWLTYGAHYIVVERNGKRWGQNVNVNESTKQVYMYDAERVSSTQSLTPYKKQRSSVSLSDWEIFNIGITADICAFNSPFYDYVVFDEGNSTQFGIGGGFVCRTSYYDSIIIPTFGVRYMYAFEVGWAPYQPAVKCMSIPIICNINWTGGTTFTSIYSGIGVEPTYYMIRDYDYEASYWGFPFAFNIIGIGTRHFNLDLYLNYSRKAKEAAVLGLRMSLLL